MNNCTRLFVALSNAYTMLTQCRGLVPVAADTATLFDSWRALRFLRNDARFDQLTREVLRLQLTHPDVDDAGVSSLVPPDQFQHNSEDLYWLALKTRDLVFALPDGAPKHAGITYRLAVVVVTPAIGSDAKAKLEATLTYIKQFQAAFGSQRPPTVALIRLVLGGTPSALKLDARHVIIENWLDESLQINPLEHKLAVPHTAYASLSAEDLARLPVSTRRAAAGDPMNLARILSSDIVARWHGFVPGQLICIQRSNLFEGGLSYELRYCVRE